MSNKSEEAQVETTPEVLSLWEDESSEDSAAPRPSASLGLWIEALRSGDYRQNMGCLREVELIPGAEPPEVDTDSSPKCCCLGVFCEIMGFKNYPAVFGNRYIYVSPDDGAQLTTSLGAEIMKSIFPDLKGGPWLAQAQNFFPATMEERQRWDWIYLELQAILMQMNDKHKSFSEIADFLEAHFGSTEGNHE